MVYHIEDDINEIISRLEKENISFKDKKILVSGGAGFLGSWVCDVLVKQGATCICIDKTEPEPQQGIIQKISDMPLRGPAGRKRVSARIVAHRG